MNFFKTNQIVVLFSIAIMLLSCKVLKAQTSLPKVENHLNGELDYKNEVLELVQKQANGEEISLGKINKDGTIHFNLPEFNIKAIYDSINLQHYRLQDLFLMNSCKDKDRFVETPYDNVYSQKYDPIYIKKYGTNIAALYPVSDEKIVSRNNNNRTVLPNEATFFWFYIDRDMSYKEQCFKTSSWGTENVEVAVSANIQFTNGWNFVEENLLEVQNVGQGNSQTITPKTIEFNKSSPVSKKVKWILKQIQEDEKIQTAKRLYNLTPITKEQFEKWPPKKLGDLSITTQEYGNPPKGEKNKNHIHLIYADKTQKKEIDLYVIDCAKNPDDMEMTNFAYAMENHGKAEKDIKPYVAQYSEREKATNLLYKVGDRIIVNASAKNIEDEALWEYIKKLNVEKLLNN